MCLVILLFPILFITGCGYKLAGQGQGVVPEDVHIVAIYAPAAASLANMLRHHAGHKRGYVIVIDADSDTADAEFHISGMNETFLPSSYDASGIAQSYNLTLTASISLWRDGLQIWNGGNINVREDVYAIGDPSSIQAARQRISNDLQQEWASEAWLRISSGF
ncbi:MAG: hypothetical protein R8L53_02430 [Mariprofundales bacterium]